MADFGVVLYLTGLTSHPRFCIVAAEDDAGLGLAEV